MASLAEAGAIFNQPDWVAAALCAAEFIANVHLDVTGHRLLRTSRDGVAGLSWGVLDDYANVAEGFLALYQVSGDEKWIILTGKLLDNILAHFDDGAAGFFDTADNAPSLVRRPQSISDNAEPAGWLAAANALLSYAAITGKNSYRIRAEAALAKITPLITRAPRAVGWGLVAATAMVDGPMQIAIVGAKGEETEKLWRLAWTATAPGAVVARAAPDADSQIGLLQNRAMLDGVATAYLCRGFVCDLPTNDPNKLMVMVRK